MSEFGSTEDTREPDESLDSEVLDLSRRQNIVIGDTHYLVLGARRAPYLTGFGKAVRSSTRGLGCTHTPQNRK